MESRARGDAAGGCGCAVSPLTVRSDWGYWDALDGADLQEGELCFFNWPDNTETAEIVRIECRSFTYSDQGHTCQGPDCRAFVSRVTLGTEVKIYLRDMKGLRMSREMP